jgi:hypothetical protein
MKIIECKQYKILVTDDVAKKMNFLTQICDVEISGLGTVHEHVDGTIVVDGLYVFKQQCNPGFTQIDREDLSAFYTKMIEDGKEEEINRMKFWWHSHVNMPVFWSGTDIQNMVDLNNSNYLVSIVTNKSSDWKAAVKIKSPSILLDNVSAGIVGAGDCNLAEIYEECVKDVREKVNR